LRAFFPSAPCVNRAQFVFSHTSPLARRECAFRCSLLSSKLGDSDGALAAFFLQVPKSSNCLASGLDCLWVVLWEVLVNFAANFIIPLHSYTVRGLRPRLPPMPSSFLARNSAVSPLRGRVHGTIIHRGPFGFDGEDLHLLKSLVVYELPGHSFFFLKVAVLHAHPCLLRTVLPPFDLRFFSRPEAGSSLLPRGFWSIRNHYRQVRTHLLTLQSCDGGEKNVTRIPLHISHLVFLHLSEFFSSSSRITVRAVCFPCYSKEVFRRRLRNFPALSPLNPLFS